jgi:hypothetical protein
MPGTRPLSRDTLRVSPLVSVMRELYRVRDIKYAPRCLYAVVCQRVLPAQCHVLHTYI